MIIGTNKIIIDSNDFIGREITEEDRKNCTNYIMIDSLSEIATSDMLIYNKTININGKELTLSSVSQIAIGDICYGIKKYDGMFRPDGDPIRGKWMEVTLKSDTNEEIILNSVTTEVVESKL